MKTVHSNQASPAAKALVLALRDVLSNEAAWAIAQEHLERYRDEVIESVVEGFVEGLTILTPKGVSLTDDPVFQRETIEETRAVVARVLAARRGGGNYQTLVNDALREHVEGAREDLEGTLRRVIREELARRPGPRG